MNFTVYWVQCCVFHIARHAQETCTLVDIAARSKGKVGAARKFSVPVNRVTPGRQHAYLAVSRVPPGHQHIRVTPEHQHILVNTFWHSTECPQGANIRKDSETVNPTTLLLLLKGFKNRN